MLLDLANAQTWSAEVGRAGIDVRVRSGEVWITRQRDEEDHVLHAGDELKSDWRGKLVVYALSPAALEVAPLSALLHPLRLAHADAR
jgi:hypothetical protein